MTINTSYLVRLAPFMILSILAWFAFVLFYRSFWPGSSAPGENLTLFWIWLSAGTVLFVATVLLTLHLFRTKTDERGNVALALTAPALICDIFTVTFFESWFANGGGADDRFYAALILGGVGAIQLASLATTAPLTQQDLIEEI